ncbi:MAG: hypothetical protein KKB31_05790 [Nanoarchaeota archaeon]|nr:hypothetical protein [Nanoarchaeota archaeon]
MVKNTLPMKFNPGLKKYEPDLPLKKSKKHVSPKIELKGLIILIAILILIGTFLVLISRYAF